MRNKMDGWLAAHWLENLGVPYYTFRPTPTVRGCGSAFARDAERGARPLGKKNRGLLPAACGTAVASPPTPPAAVGSRVNLEGDEGFRWTTASRRRSQPLAGIKIPPALQHSRRRPRVVVPKSVRQLLPGGALPPPPKSFLLCSNSTTEVCIDAPQKSLLLKKTSSFHHLSAATFMYSTFD